MILKEFRAKAGFESIVEQAKHLIAKNQEAMDAEIAEVIAPIQDKYNKNLAGYNKIIEEYSEEYDVDVEEALTEEFRESSEEQAPSAE